MKKTLFILLFAGASCFLHAQAVRINLYNAYVFDDGYSFFYDEHNYYEGTIKASYQFGAGFEYLLNSKYSVEIMYLRQNTHSPVTYQKGVTEPIQSMNIDLHLNYILLGFQTMLLSKNGTFESSAGVLAGMAISDMTDPVDGTNASIDKFSWGGRLATIINASGRIGLKLQAQLLSIVKGSGGGFYFSNLGGGGAALSTYSTIYQLGLGGALVLKLGGPKKEKSKLYLMSL
jgi:hypothetical protein